MGGGKGEGHSIMLRNLWRTAARAVTLFAVLAMTPPAVAPPAEAQAPSFGPLEPTLTPGQDGPWTRIRDGAAFELVNTTDPNALKFFFVTTDQDTFGRRRVSVDVAMTEASDLSHAGLLYGFVEDPRF